MRAPRIVLGRLELLAHVWACRLKKASNLHARSGIHSLTLISPHLLHIMVDLSQGHERSVLHLIDAAAEC